MYLTNYICISIIQFFIHLGNPPSDGKELITMMFNKHHGKWYKNQTFTQTSNFYKNDTLIHTEIWYEAIQYPGKLTIKMGTKNGDKGMIYKNDIFYQFENGKLVKTMPRLHELMVLMGDVYFYEPRVTVHKLYELKIDLTIVREDVFNGIPVYIVGAKAGDTTSNQFWVDKETLCLLRYMGTNERYTQDIICDNYKTIDNYLVCSQIRFYINGMLYMTEDYSDIRFPEKLDASVFDEKKINKINW